MFIVYAMPRSRSFWLSKFLTYGEWICGHDELRFCRSLDDVKTWFRQPCVGSVETLGAPWWRLAPSGAKVVTLRRPIDEVVESLVSVGFERGVMQRLTERVAWKLDQIEARVPEVLATSFAELATEEGCRRVFEHCLPYQHDHAWWERWAPVNAQANIGAIIRYCQAFRWHLEHFGIEARAETLARMNRKKATAPNGFTFQAEDFDTVFRDGQALFDDHAKRFRVDGVDRINLPLVRMLSQMNTALIVTARSNGKLFGYTIAVVGPSMEDPDKLVAKHVSLYASRETPRLGMKLQRAANDLLRDRGVNSIFYRVGSEQTKLGPLYQRLGAAPYGNEYMLRLN